MHWRWSRHARRGGTGRLLLVNVFLLGTVVTAFLSLDVTIIVVTPIVYVLTAKLEIDPLPYLFACAFLANTASLFLPISNLTNILIYDLLHLSFARFALVMAGPNLAALAVNIGLFFVIFCRRIPRHVPTSRLTMPERPPGFAVASVGLAVVLGGLLVFGFAALPLAMPACIGAGALGGYALARGRITVRRLNAGIAWPLFPFVLAMFVVIRGVEGTWLPRLPALSTSDGLPNLLLVAFGTAVGANLVNNIPMIAAMIGLLRDTGAAIPNHLAFATLVGTNIGPSVLTFGSLATMLWLTHVRKRGVPVSAGAYTRVGLLRHAADAARRNTRLMAGAAPQPPVRHQLSRQKTVHACPVCRYFVFIELRHAFAPGLIRSRCHSESIETPALLFAMDGTESPPACGAEMACSVPLQW